jgi:transposase
MPAVKRRRYTKQFKEEAVRLLETDSRSGDDIARDLGVERGMLYRWKRELQGKSTPVGSVADALSPDERAELRRLRRENAQLREEREILKKATAFFAKHSK